MDEELLEGLEPAKAEAPQQNQPQAGGYNKSGGNFKKSEFTNVQGEMTLNLWDGDKPTPTEIDSNTFKEGKKFFTLVLASRTYTPTEDELKLIVTIVKALNRQGYMLRMICNYARGAYDAITKAIEADDMYLITPWRSYCKDGDKKAMMWLPSDENANVAANYTGKYDRESRTRDFNALPAPVRYINAGIIASLFGRNNNQPSTFVVVVDPFYTGDKIDYQKSRESSNYYYLAKQLSVPLYNVAMPTDKADLIALIRKGNKDTEQSN